MLKDVLILLASQARAMDFEVPEDVPDDAYVAVRRRPSAVGFEYVGVVGVVQDLAALQDEIHATADVLLEPEEREPGPPDAPTVVKGKNKTTWAPAESPSTVHPRGQAMQAWQSEFGTVLDLRHQDALLDALYTAHRRMLDAAEGYARVCTYLGQGDLLACLPALEDVRSHVRESWRILGETVGQESALKERAARQLADVGKERDDLEKEVESFAAVRATYDERVRHVRMLLDQALAAPTDRTSFEVELDLALRDLEDLTEGSDQPTRNNDQARRLALAMKAA